MGGGNTEASEQQVPEAEWSDMLSRFQKEHAGARISVQIEEPDGSRTQLESEERFELGLMGVSEQTRGARRYVRVVVHKHPGAEIETVEIEEPARILRKDGGIVVESAGGRRAVIQPFSA